MLGLPPLTLETLSKILENFASRPHDSNTYADVGENEQIVVTDVDAKILRNFAESRRVLRDAEDLAQKLYPLIAQHIALKELTWAGIKSTYDEASKADQRGDYLGIRKDANGRPVIVSFARRDDSGNSEIPDFIRRLLE